MSLTKDIQPFQQSFWLCLRNIIGALDDAGWQDGDEQKVLALAEQVQSGAEMLARHAVELAYLMRKRLGLPLDWVPSDYEAVSLRERDFLLAEVQWLEELLADMPKEDVIDRMSLEARLRRAKDLLAHGAECSCGGKCKDCKKGAAKHPPKGTLLEDWGRGGNRILVFADGKGGTYTEHETEDPPGYKEDLDA